jgi:hypothetical protein
VKRVILMVLVLVGGLVAAATPAEACSFCDECRESRNGLTYYCWGTDDGAEHCMQDIWGNCWVYGDYCGCIVVY